MKNYINFRNFVVVTILVLRSPIYSQTTSALTTNLQSQLDVVASKISGGDLEGAKSDLNSVRTNLAQFEAYKEAAVESERKQYELVIKPLNEKIASLEQTVKDLEDKIVILKKGNETETLKIVEGILVKRNEQQVKIDELKTENGELKKTREDLSKENSELKVSIATTTVTNGNLQKDLEAINSEINKYKSVVKIGLAIGFDSYWGNQRDYVVQKDSTIKEIGNGKGITGLISGVMTIRMSKPESNKIQHSIVINVPLLDIFNSSDKAVGLFNNRAAVGLGYAISPFKDTPQLSFTGIFNASPFQKLDYEALKNEKVTLQKYSKLKPDDFGATSSISFSFTVGVIYSFIDMGKKKG